MSQWAKSFVCEGVTVSCHGETWRVSSKKGKLQ